MSTPTVPQPEWQVLIRDPDRAIVGEISYQSLELWPRHLALPTWSLDIPFDGDLDSPAAQLLLPNSGILVIANGTPVFSGPTTSPLRVRDGDVQTLQAAGTGDLQLVADREAHPDPANADSPDGTSHKFAAAADTITDKAETVVKHFVSASLGADAITDRQIAALTIETDAARGTTVTGTARWDNISLLEFLVPLARAGSIGFKVVQSDATTLTFSVYEPQNKSASVVFAVELGNVKGYQYGNDRPTANVLYVGGPGDGADRIFAVVTDTDSVDAWGRIEQFYDQGGAATYAELVQAGETQLLTTAAKAKFSATTVNTAGHEWAPIASDPAMETFDVGDAVSVIVDGERIVETIQELHVTHDETGTTIDPTIGSTDQTGDGTQEFYDAVVADIRTLRAQVRELGRR